MSITDPVRTRPVFTVTCTNGPDVHIQKALYMLTVSTLPGEPLGPYNFGEIKHELLVRALLDPATARNTALDAWCAGTARVEGVIFHTTAPMED
jgi:hypothetical protein